MDQLQHNDIIDRLSLIGNSNVDIKSNYRWNISEFQGDVREGSEFPLMTYESPTIVPTNTESNLLLEYNCAFNILGMEDVDTSDPEDEEAQNLVLNHCLNIALEVFRKLIEYNEIPFDGDVRNRWYSILQKLQVSFTKVGPVTNHYLYGYRCEFALNPKFSTITDPAKWV